MSTVLLLSACADDFTHLAPLAGGWEGVIETDSGAVIPATATLTVDEGLLSGQMDLIEPDGVAHSYALRRSEVLGSIPHLSWTDLSDPARGLVVDGAAADGRYDGQATVRFPCEIGICGWTGVMTLHTTTAR